MGTKSTVYISQDGTITWTPMGLLKSICSLSYVLMLNDIFCNEFFMNRFAQVSDGQANLFTRI